MNDENIVESERKMWDVKVIFSFFVAVVFIGIGFYKLFAYSNSDLGDKVNAYVGGDAYNYIINSNLGAAYFIFVFDKLNLSHFYTI